MSTVSYDVKNRDVHFGLVFAEVGSCHDTLQNASFLAKMDGVVEFGETVLPVDRKMPGEEFADIGRLFRVLCHCAQKPQKWNWVSG